VAVLLGALLLSACSAASAAPAPNSLARPLASRSSTRGGTVTWAEQPGTPPNSIFPFGPIEYETEADEQQFQDLMYQPLYWFGNGSSPTLNETLSIGKLPIFKDGDKVVTVDLKDARWSDGEPVDARDILFFMNMARTEKDNWGQYIPGEMPDNVRNVVASGKYQVTFYLNRSYNPTWFTYNQLSLIFPLPKAWDLSRHGAAPGSGGCSSASYVSIVTNKKTGAPISAAAKRCAADFTYLSLQSGYNPSNPSAENSNALASYATNPLWQVVDGPWHLTAFNSDGLAEFLPNKKYIGADHPRIAKFIEEPFTSAIAEYNALLAGAVSVGYLPSSEVTADSTRQGVPGPNNPALSGHYKLTVGIPWGINYVAPSYVSLGDHGMAKRIFNQLYFRQAIQFLVDQPAYVKKVYKGYALPTYGPVPIEPPTWASASERHNPYPYNPGKAISTLRSHGWHVVSGGISTCVRPGSGRTDCGAGIRRGAQLNFALVFAEGEPTLTELMDVERASWEEAGIRVSLSEAGDNAVVGIASPTSTSWDMADWGFGWLYTPDYYPAGGEVFAGGADGNLSAYDSPVANADIVANHTTTGVAAIHRYQNYLAHDLPVIWQPNPMTVDEVAKNLQIGPLNPMGTLTPASWYFVK